MMRAQCEHDLPRLQGGVESGPGSLAQRAARGGLVLVFSQGCFFLFGYLSVVILARGFGPAVYGVYAVILSVQAWLEQSGHFALPTAAARLLSQSEGQRRRELAKASIITNTGLYSVCLAAVWLIAPLLETSFGIENGAFLFRLAALNLPVFGVYSALQAVQQAQHRYFRLGAAAIIYSCVKLVGAWLIVQSGVTLEKALIVHILATTVAFLILLPQADFWRCQNWLAASRPILSRASSSIVFSTFVVLSGSVALWVLQILMSGQQVAVGVYVAAWNIARVPGYALAAVSAVLLPSVAEAIAKGESQRVGSYVRQCLRFFLLAYLPVIFVLTVAPEPLMKFVYTGRFSGGGALLVPLALGQAVITLVAILCSVLIGAGHVRRAAVIVTLSSVVGALVTAVMVVKMGAMGAALSGLVVHPLALAVIVGLLRWQFGPVFSARSAGNALLAGVVMFGVGALVGGPFWLGHVLGLLCYGLTLVAIGEIGRQELRLFWSPRVQAPGA